MLKSLRKNLKYYSWSHKTRVAQSLRSVNLAWRTSAIIIVALAIFIIYDYLQGKYPEAISYTPLAAGALPQVFVLGDKLFTWFLIGVFFGIIALSVINEGEYFLAIRRLAKDVEREAQKEAGTLARGLGKPGKQRAKRGKRTER